MTDQIKVLYWNIHGISSRVNGEKHKDPRFIEIISDYDVVCLSELHSDKEIYVPGFTSMKQKIRTKRHKGPKISGGIGVFIRRSIAKNFQVIPNKNEDSIWLRTTPKSEEPIRLGFYYCSPENSTSTFTETVGKEIEHFIDDQTYIFGDFNARTRTDCENLAYDKSDDDLGIPTTMQDIPPPRNSEDKKLLNKRGKDFLDLCKLNDLCIANGRTIGDIFGRYTCHQARGSSVVDYLIVPFKTLPTVSEFSVGDYLPTLSDHSPLLAKININQLMKEDTYNEVDLQDLPGKYIWNQDTEVTFKNKISTPAFKQQVNNIMATEDNPNLVHDIQNLLTGTADSCKIKKTTRRKGDQNKPWFDDECKELKNNIGRHGKTLRQQPHDIKTRELLYVDQRKLRNMIKRKKYNYKRSIVDSMCSNLSKGEQKTYWKMLKKLEGPKDNTKYLHEQQLIDHLKDILNDPTAKDIPQDLNTQTQEGNLDFEISRQELDAARKILRNGKSPGLDQVINEMIDPVVENYPKMILKLFNSILHNTWICDEWLISLITAIHKKGAKDDPSNYRGISLMSCMAKLFLTIINNRLINYAMEREILSPNQLGFVQLNRTSDPHIILNNLVQKYCHKKKKKLFGCFVDFSKAFDSVPRDILMDKLRKHGIDGKVFEIIRTLYTQDKAGVKFGDKFSNPFKTNRGVRQGCVLSPLLFNIFLADIQGEFDRCGDNPKLGDQEISCLIWADDILILSETEQGLQAKLDNLQVYCKKNKLEVNTDKTKIMTFTKSGRLLLRNFFFGKIELENVREYKYLGFIVTPSGEIHTGLKDLRIRALRALAKIKKALGPLFQQDIWNTKHLYNYMVKPILLYNSDFWGCLKHPKNSPIESVHLGFHKQLLGVRKQTNTSAVHLEVNSTPLLYNAIKGSVKNWERIKHNKCNTILRAAYIEASKENLSWISSIKEVFQSNGLTDNFLATEEETEDDKRPHNILFNILKDNFKKSTLESIRESSRLKMYSMLKQEARAERYLSYITDTRHRTALTRLRLSSHSLHIETGRHTGTDREDRICTLCRTGVEDESHFLITCPMYNDLRSKHLTDFRGTLTSSLSDLEKALALLMSENLKPLAKFIFEASEMRNILIDSQLTIDSMLDKIEHEENTSARIADDVQNTLLKMIVKIESIEKRDAKVKREAGDKYTIKHVCNNGLKIILKKI